jgi:putative ATP-dependent endonuclease of OLD family
MRLSRVTIRNFRNFEFLDLTDLPRSVVLVGENGAGKSNLLSALRLVLDSSLPDAARQLGPEDFWDGLARPFDGNEVEISIELTDLEEDQAAQAALDKCFVSRSPFAARLTYLYRPGPKFDEDDAGDYEFLIFGGGDETHVVQRGTRRFLAMRVLPALRDAEAELSNWSRSPLRQLLQRLDIPQAHLEELAAQLQEATGTLLGDPSLKSLSDAISDRVREMVGEVFAVATQLGVGALRPEQVLRAVRLFLQGEKVRTLSEASLGSANVVYLALLLQVIQAQREAHELVSTILGVEEPEAHLHPHLQRVLFRYLLRDQDMLWVTTHSAHIASVTPLRSLVLLRRTAHASEAFVATGARLTDQQTTDIERYLDVTRAELLFAKGIILIEGLAEAYLLPAVATTLGIDLDGLGITVCSVHGVDFLPYVRLLADNGFAIPYVVVTDGDARPNRRGIAQAGLRRGLRLMTGLPQQGVQEAFAANDFERTRSLLENFGIYVGHETLELDLLESNADRILVALGQLGLVADAAERFRAEIPGAVAGDAAAASHVMQTIERIGKGRLAQRLASDASELVWPRYLVSAVEAIRAQVQQNDASAA